MTKRSSAPSAKKVKKSATKATMGKEKKKSMPMSTRCELTFPPSRVLTILKTGRLQRVSSTSAVFATASMESLVSALLDACKTHLGNSDEEKKKRLTLGVLAETIQGNKSLASLLAGHSLINNELLGSATEVVLSKDGKKKRRIALQEAKAEREAKKAAAAAE